MAQGLGIVCQTAWYDKRHPTFSDALALVRRELWAQENDMVKVPREFVNGYRRGLLCGPMAKVQLRDSRGTPDPSEVMVLRLLQPHKTLTTPPRTLSSCNMSLLAICDILSRKVAKEINYIPGSSARTAPRGDRAVHLRYHLVSLPVGSETR
jgi:hypothetical protein